MSKLIHDSGKILQIGDTVKDFRNEDMTIKGWTSGRDWSDNGGTGRVHTDRGTFFPGVINARIVESDE